MGISLPSGFSSGSSLGSTIGSTLGAAGQMAQTGSAASLTGAEGEQFAQQMTGITTGLQLQDSLDNVVLTAAKTIADASSEK
ncbi:hypothetical protein QYH69_23815 [Paraburkholderia sp. SARCC-3016]|uniref:hypothetical protein n=1 Tax=Paraburkholderia sp. SARCC-3016 TaxID=3058611 RepID=UPI002808AA89|nr:hypothetical protein [Paraburkholderia sp. SARCC-3016]MDQ7980275.1 hypothetical protein [Paraburkholderia sp. SARCC-3016]